MVEDEVQFATSHESIKLGVRPLRRSDGEVVLDEGVSGKKKSKILQDITNNLSVHPRSPKPTRSGPSDLNGPDKKASDTPQAATDHSSAPLGPVVRDRSGGVLGPRFGPIVAGSSPTRPPDLAVSNLGQDPLEGVPSQIVAKEDSGGLVTDRMEHEVDLGILDVGRRWDLDMAL